MPPVVEVAEVYKSFKEVHAVRGVSFSIERGRSTALLGPNGAGKTTLVEMIEGIQTPDKGRIRILGKGWQHHADELHRAIGLSLQETRFIDKLTVYETVRLFASFYGLGKARVGEVLELVQLAGKRNAYTVNLSGGQRQRLALGLSLINRPQVLLLDEPTTGLDPNARREIWSILLNLKARSKTALVLTTHYMEEAEKLCDYIMIMDQGRVLTEGTLEDLLVGDEESRVIDFALSDGRARPLDDWADVMNDAPFDIRWHPQTGRGRLATADFETEIPQFFNFLEQKGLRLKDMQCRHKTLDDLFTAMTGRRLNE